MYQAGIYCRVSVEELVKEGEYSNSIQSQVKMSEEYIAEQQDVILTASYLDDGVSGSNFDRPEFRRMLADIERGKINMVIVKDISRLGREHIDTNYYLGKYFPEKNIRVISLLDRYDSRYGTYDEIMDIKTLMNDMYLRDTSKKIKAVIRSKRNSGEYTMKEPPYGYVKSKTVHNHLEIDPYAATVVQRIYNLYLGGYGIAKISGILNKEDILCPSRYKKEIRKTGYPYPTGRGLWEKSSVNAILKNPVYTGAIVIRKTERYSYNLKYKKVIPLQEREICENAHEKIISREQFEAVQKALQSRRVSSFDKAAAPHKYSGLLFCGKCGYAMRKRYLASRNSFDGYMCGSHRSFGENCCELNHITFEKLDELVAYSISQQMKDRKEEWKKLSSEVKKKEYEFSEQRERLQMKIDRNKEYCKKAYEQYIDKVLGKEEYLNLKFMYEQENIQYQREWRRLEEKVRSIQQSVNETIKWLERFRKGKITEKQLTRELLEELVEKINIYPEQQIEISFRFGNPCEEGRISCTEWQHTVAYQGTMGKTK